MPFESLRNGCMLRLSKSIRQGRLHMRQVGTNVFLVLMSLLVIGLLGAPAWSEQSKINKPYPCSTNIDNPTPITGPTVVFEWSKDDDVDYYTLLVGMFPGKDDYCDSDETTATSYTCAAIPTKAGKYVFAQLQVTTNKPGSYNHNCIYITK